MDYAQIAELEKRALIPTYERLPLRAPEAPLFQRARPALGRRPRVARFAAHPASSSATA